MGGNEMYIKRYYVEDRVYRLYNLYLSYESFESVI